MKTVLLFSLSAVLLLSTLDASAQTRRERRLERKAQQEQTTRERTPSAPSEIHERDAQPRQVTPQDQQRQDTRENNNDNAMATGTVPTVPVNVRQLEAAMERTAPVSTQHPNGQVNWTGQFIEARGESVIDTERFPNAAQARAMAVRGAVVVAQRNLLEIINGVQVTSETRVVDMITQSDYIYTRVDGLVKGARMVGEPIEKFGMMEVTLRIDIYETNGLAPLLYDALPADRRATGGSGMGGPEQVLPGDGTHEEIVEALVFQMKEGRFDPAMFPVIVDENGQILLDLTKLYDPRKGKFPRILQTGRDVFEEIGFREGVQIIDVISSHSGTITIDNKHTRGIDWGKVGRTIGTLGRLALMFI
ncbi:MAG: LPP20 family lipoprotein [Bacteroidales bacterium]